MIRKDIEKMEDAIEQMSDEKWYLDGLAIMAELTRVFERHRPKKPIDDRYPWCICPNCKGSVYVKHIQEHIQNDEITYCEHCGQALDWSDSE